METPKAGDCVFDSGQHPISPTGLIAVAEVLPSAGARFRLAPSYSRPTARALPEAYRANGRVQLAHIASQSRRGGHQGAGQWVRRAHCGEAFPLAPCTRCRPTLHGVLDSAPRLRRAHEDRECPTSTDNADKRRRAPRSVSHGTGIAAELGVHLWPKTPWKWDTLDDPSSPPSSTPN
jgi:hypothetical protein